MGWRTRTETLPRFTQCPGCTYDFLTAEGTRACSWYECPYLPEAYKVVCPDCGYNFATREGRPRCSDPPSCDLAVEGFKHARNARARFGQDV